MKILLLEDEKMLHTSIVEYLTAVGHSVEGFMDGEDALEALTKQKYDLLILDINVPNLDGLSLLEKVYALKIYTPAIYISALVEIEDISRAFDIGCYDYLKKPFHLKELMLRINKVMQMNEQPHEHTMLTSHYSFDLASQTLYFDKVAQVLSKRQQQMIALLAQNCNRIVDFEMFRSYVWDDAIIDNATIRAEMSRLKKVLKEDFIINIRAVGYMVEAPKP